MDYSIFLANSQLFFMDSIIQNYSKNRNVCLNSLLGVLADKLTSFFEGRDFSATPPPPFFSIHF